MFMACQDKNPVEGEGLVCGSSYPPAMIQQVYKTLPDDEPILSICVVEDPVKCPPGYYVVNRTHDQDSDADLYRQSALFGKRNTRYLCISKIHGIADLIVESIAIVGEKDPPPASYCVMAKTKDTDQKAWRKSQLCYKVARRTTAIACVTDIILLSRMKKAPDGFLLGGEINGLTLCYKVGTNTNGEIIARSGAKSTMPQLAYSLNPRGPSVNGNSNVLPMPLPHRRAPAENPPVNDPGYQNVALNNDDDSPHEYEKLVISPLSPKRPAPLPPTSAGPLPLRPAPKLPSTMSTYATLGSFQGLEGIPFVLNTKLQFNSSKVTVPPLKFRTAYEIEKEFDYDFRLERQT
ncbi:multivesicular body subunit 12B isoform X1 [Frankliniella occidentalis]|uniref:Multivesicular body subunit 12A n=2 Tax=Frankliniella occidentalis TaxID=133901 RepID=A0A6J1ST97_FRAOC|nr:multivesicular body subunit 12B isoform X1 [Frankliniella occidentalis]